LQCVAAHMDNLQLPCLLHSCLQLPHLLHLYLTARICFLTPCGVSLQGCQGRRKGSTGSSQGSQA
jgi:hypothetical protein